MDLREEIAHLISMHQEGPYWDFKKQWCTKEKDADLLFDIICMANNLKDRDAYIIIGVDEKADYSICDVHTDPNRKDTQRLTDFLGGKRFAGDFRPMVTVESLSFSSGMIDVIVIHNSLDVPFYLKERYKDVPPGNVFVRLQDSNTPRDKAADLHDVEYLWKKRFGMLLAPLDKVMLYLQHPEDWEDAPGEEDKRYYKYAPEYTIEHDIEPDEDRNGYEYYQFAQTNTKAHWNSIRVYFHQTVIAELLGASLDGAYYYTSTPRSDGIDLRGYHNWDVPYKFMVKGDINYIVHEFYYAGDINKRDAHDRYEECILIFENEDEHTRFNDYAAAYWSENNKARNNIRIPNLEEIPKDIRAGVQEQYRSVQILRRMLEAFRQSRRI